MYLGITLNKLGDFDSACAAFEKALQMDRNDCTIFLNYAITLFNQGFKDKAMQLFTDSEKIFKELDEDDKEPEMIDQREVLMEALGIN